MVADSISAMAMSQVFSTAEANSWASLMIGNDSGPRHLAGAVGTPTVAVFTYANLADVAPRLTRRLDRRGRSRMGGRSVLESEPAERDRRENEGGEEHQHFETRRGSLHL